MSNTYTNNPSTKPRKSASDIIASASRPAKPSAPAQNYKNDPRKQLWCDTVWTNLSIQAKNVVKLPTLPYFDPDTMLLSREVNAKLWGQLVGF
jgi:hypothetical protein